MKLRYCDGGSFMGDSAVYINSVCLLFGALVHILFALWIGALAYRLAFANRGSPQRSTSVARGYGTLLSPICSGRDWREPTRFPVSFPCSLLRPCHPLALFSIDIISCFDLAWASALRIPGSALRLFGRRPSYVLPLRRP